MMHANATEIDDSDRAESRTTGLPAHGDAASGRHHHGRPQSNGLPWDEEFPTAFMAHAPWGPTERDGSGA